VSEDEARAMTKRLALEEGVLQEWAAVDQCGS
jgi:hypothetical protein